MRVTFVIFIHHLCFYESCVYVCIWGFFFSFGSVSKIYRQSQKLSLLCCVLYCAESTLRSDWASARWEANDIVKICFMQTNYVYIIYMLPLFLIVLSCFGNISIFSRQFNLFVSFKQSWHKKKNWKTEEETTKAPQHEAKKKRITTIIYSGRRNAWWTLLVGESLDWHK